MVDIDAVAAAVRKVCDIDADTVLPTDASLWERGLDSVRVVELVVLLENELDITFPDEYLVGDTFATVESTLEAVRRFAT